MADEKPETEVVKETPADTAANLLAQNIGAAKPEETTTVVEESPFDIDLDEKPADTTPASRIKFTKDKFKELDEDILPDDEEFELDAKSAALLDKVFDRAKSYKAKANDFKTVAEANQTISNDELIKTWDSALSMDDEKLLLNVELSKYKKAGYSDEEALSKANEAVTELKEESEKLFKRQADGIRLELRSAINQRVGEIQSNISKTAKALSLSDAPNPELISKAIEKLSKTDNFLGLKIGGKSEQSKKDFIKPIEAAIKDGSLLKKLQSDPDLLAEFGLYALNKDRFQKAIEKRTPAKRQILEKLDKAPHSNGAAPLLKSDVVSKEGGLKDPQAFK